MLISLKLIALGHRVRKFESAVVYVIMKVYFSKPNTGMEKRGRNIQV